MKNKDGKVREDKVDISTVYMEEKSAADNISLGLTKSRTVRIAASQFFNNPRLN